MIRLDRILFCFILVFASNAFANECDPKFCHPFYFGLSGGYGSTTWQGLVPTKVNESAALILSTPIQVSEGGAMWGLYAGYEFIPTFALEATYFRYTNAKVSFDPKSLVAFKFNGLTQLTTHTETAGLMAKFMVIIPHTTIRVYSSAGAAGIHRYDQLFDDWRVGPTFEVGANYNFTDRIMSELGFNYTGGYGESEINPSEDYVPFLYNIYLRIGYRFG